MFLPREAKEKDFKLFSLYIHQSWWWGENFSCIGDTMQLWPPRREMKAVLVPLNAELLQMKQLLMFLGCIYSGRSCGKDYHSAALSSFLKISLKVGLLKCFRSKNGKAPNIYGKEKWLLLEKAKQYLPKYKSSLFIYLLIMIFLLEVTSLS